MASLQNPRPINLFTAKAQVFQINETGTTWLQKVEGAINVSLVLSFMNENHPNSPMRRELRIIANDDNGDIVLDDLVTPETKFHERNEKFCQWLNHQNTVCGLGFSEKHQLTDFIAKFKQFQHEHLSAQQRTRRSAQNLPLSDRPDLGQRSQIAGGSNDSDGRQSQRGSVSSGNMQQFSSSTLAHPGHQQANRRQQALSNGDSLRNVAQDRNGDSGLGNNPSGFSRSQSTMGISAKTVHNGTLPRGRASPQSIDKQSDTQTKEQLRFEVARLRQALEENASKAALWQTELMTLQTNNVKLTQALHESRANVSEWVTELSNLREENEALRSTLAELDSGDADLMHKYKKEVVDLRGELTKKNTEVERLQGAMDELAISKQKLDDKLNNNMTTSSMIKTIHKNKLDTILSRLDTELGELINIKRDFSSIMDSINH